MAKKLMNIAVLITAIDTNAQVSILRSLEHFIEEYNCNIAVFTWFTGAFENDRHNAGELNIVNLPDLNLFDGVIVVANTIHLEGNQKRIAQKLQNVTKPIVFIGTKMKDYYFVGGDSYQAMRELVEHFIVKHGMRRLHFVRGIAGNPDAEERFRAYLDALEAHGIPVDENEITQGDFDILGGEYAAARLLNSGRPLPDAIICANDIMAITICGILQKNGYSIPGHVAVSGYDGSEEGRQHEPVLTSVYNSADKQAEAACKLLWDLAHGEVVPREIRIPDSVVWGESCGCVRGDAVYTYGEQRSSMRKAAFRRTSVRHMLQQAKDIMLGNKYQDWLLALRTFIEKMEPGEFYCCTNSDFMETVFGRSIVEQENMSAYERQHYTEMSKVMLAYKDGKFFQKQDFPSCYGLDEMFAEGQRGKMYIFSPIHYLDRNYGYVVFVNSEVPIGDTLYVKWLIDMGHAIENMRKHCLLETAMQALDDMYVKDSLTGVYNRFGQARFSQVIKMRCIKEGKPVFIGFVDLDDLKLVNDRFGHEEGDYVIKRAAELLGSVGMDFEVARYGGDEFVVMGVVSDAEEAAEYWRRVDKLVDAYNAANTHRGRLSLSYGYHVGELSMDTDMEEYVRNADVRMYQAKNIKKSGRKKI